MGSEMEFGPDTDSIRRWLEQRQTYKTDGGGKHRGAEPVREAVFVTAPDRPARSAPAPGVATPDSGAAGRAVLEALGTVGSRPAADPGSQPAAPEPAAGGAPGAEATPAAPRTAATPAGAIGRSTDVTFPPRNGVRRAMSFALCGVLLAAAAAGWYAATEPSVATYGIAATLGVLLLAVWAVRAGATTTDVRIFRGQLEIRRGGGLEVADLANPYTPVAVLGVPGRRGWAVLVERPGRPLLEVDAGLVDPHPFMDALLRLRPDLRDWARANRPELLAPRVS